MSHETSGKQSVTLPEPARANLREMVERHGENRVRLATGVSRDSFARGLAGMSIRRGTVLMLLAGLQQLEQEPE